MRESGVRLPFAVEVIGFSDEEGVRYQSTYLGSRALAGTLTKHDLAAIEEKGIARARRKRGELLAYAEVHIEQGPVLEARNLALGIVSGIAGQTRVRVEFTGRAGHAGTTPMNLRQDALVRGGGVHSRGGASRGSRPRSARSTRGRGPATSFPDMSRSASTHATSKIRAADRRRRKAAPSGRETIAAKRKLHLGWTTMQDAASMVCDPKLSALLRGVVRRHEPDAPLLPSGAGHDAAALAAVCPTAMMFVRCKGGVSHHPDESVKNCRRGQGGRGVTRFRAGAGRAVDPLMYPCLTSTCSSMAL